MNPFSEKELLETCLSKLENHGLQVESRTEPPEFGNERVDATVVIRNGNHRQTYRVELRRNLNSSDIHRIKDRAGQSGEHPLLVLTRHVTRQRAELFIGDGVEFIDEAGNAYLHFPGTLIRISGEPAPKSLPRKNRRGPWREVTVRAAFAILLRFLHAEEPTIKLKLASIAEDADISMGSASNARQDLEAYGHLEKQASGYYETPDLKGFMDAWVDAYCQVLHPILHLETLAVSDLSLSGIWGGESAANRIDGMLRPEMETLYIDEPLAKWKFRHAKHIVKNAEGRGHTVTLRKTFWHIPGRSEATTPHLLTFADLTASEEGRNLEAAKRIYEQFLTRS